MTQIDEAPGLFCPGCGYDLRQIGSDRCPECGMEIDRSRLGESIIPWIHRKRIGRYRAFWRTCQMATLHPHQLAQEMSRRAHLADAMKFRWLVICHALLPLGVALMMLGYSFTERLGRVWTGSDLPGSIVQLLFVVAVWVCVAAFLYAMTGAISYFCTPQRLSIVQQNRAIALSYYACAPMAYLPLTVILSFVPLVIVLIMLDSKLNLIVTGTVALIGGFLLCLQPLAIFRTPLILLRAATHCEADRQILAGVALPLIWLLDLLLFLGVLPGMLLGIGVMILSFLK